LEDLKKRVAWAITKYREETGQNYIQIAEILGVDKNTLAAYRKEEGSLIGSVLKGLISNPNFKFSTEWLMEGRGEPFPGARESYPEICGPEENEIVIPTEIQNDYTFVPLLKDKISAGRGITAYNAIDVRVAFRREWIKRKGDPKNMSLIKVSGDSMEPTLISGDLVLVDHSKTYIDPQGGIYAITMNDTIMIKRLQIIYQNHKVLVISDNDHYEPIETDLDSVQINGKVIWFARELER